MGNRNSRRIKKGNARKSNRSLSQKPARSEQTNKELSPQLFPAEKSIQSGLDCGLNPKNKKRPLWWRLCCGMVSLVLLLLGYDGFWPRVVIDSSSAVTPGLLSYQFMFANQPCYPVEVFSANLVIVDKMTWTGGGSASGLTVSNIFSDVTIGARDTTTIRVDYALNMGSGRVIKEGSKVIIQIHYRLPLIGISKNDSQMFEAQRDVSGNLIWIKKPIGEFSEYRNKSILVSTPPKGAY